MKVPALRLPAWRPSLDSLEGLGSRRVLLYAIYTLFLFFIFLFANFPHGLLLQRLLSAIELPGMRLDVGDARFAWWKGFELQRVHLGPEDPNRAAYLETTSLFVRPGLDGLFSGRPRAFTVNGPLYGGSLEGHFASGDMNRATVTLDAVQLQRYPLFAELLSGGQLAGVLSGALTVEARGANTDELRAAGELELGDASLTDAKWSGFVLPALRFDGATAKFSVQGNRLEIQELHAEGPELTLVASGQVALREPVSDSVLNLKLSVAPGPEATDQIKTLLSFIPPPAKGAKADAPRTVSGTLAKPRIR
ncbi:MAG: type II secretion system protein GspN [Deltaproteobacteria bacterium]|nr:type II secretion system protein GspN [Deltaproteobacteria bacterium]